MNLRTELYHPISVHFPIVLAFLLVMLKIFLGFIRDKKLKDFTFQIYLGGICLTLVFSMISIYLGDMAYEAIKSTFCAHQVVTLHDDYSKLFMVFTGGWLLAEVAFYYFTSKVSLVKYTKLLNVFSFIVIFLAAFYLYKTAHSGAELVYKYGAAVVTNCSATKEN